jgi:hypothetical protein
MRQPDVQCRAAGDERGHQYGFGRQLGTAKRQDDGEGGREQSLRMRMGHAAEVLGHNETVRRGQVNARTIVRKHRIKLRPRFKPKSALPPSRVEGILYSNWNELKVRMAGHDFGHFADLLLNLRSESAKESDEGA